MSAGRILVKAGPIAVGVVGASVAAASTATVVVAVGAAVAVAATGYGVYRYFSGRHRLPTRSEPERLE